ncbi:MAG: right-handed parallel beta-helix repeat-containing protein, partial [Thermoanaerobaculia bacterium]
MRPIPPRLLLTLWTLLAVSPACAATEFYVSSTGSADGAGTIANPMSLDAALNGPSAKSGDTIWLRGGTYRHSPSVWPGSFWCTLKGTASAPITIRQYPGERATVDGAGTLAAIVIGGNGDRAAHVVFRDLELTDSSAVRGQSRASGLWVRDSTDLHFINLVIHDVEQGVGFWVENTDSEVYGCVVYYNGSSNLSHGIYAGNVGPAVKRIQDNIIFSNYGYGVHVYSSAGGSINNFLIEGNVVFENGKLKPLAAGASPNGANLLVGGETVAVSPQVISNFTYFAAFAPGEAGDGQQLGYLAG